MRAALALIEEDRKGMARALYANGMIGGDDLTKELNSINSRSDELRSQVLGADLDSEAEDYDMEPPMPTEG